MKAGSFLSLLSQKKWGKNMQKLKGIYPLDGIKYFRPEKATCLIACPECCKGLFLDIGDGMVEYPADTQRATINCDCGHEFGVDVEIKLKYKIKVVVITQTLIT